MSLFEIKRKTYEKLSKFSLALFFGMGTLSSISGFLAAFIEDVYPAYEGMRIFFTFKAVIWGMISIAMLSSYFSYKKEYV